MIARAALAGLLALASCDRACNKAAPVVVSEAAAPSAIVEASAAIEAGADAAPKSATSEDVVDAGSPEDDITLPAVPALAVATIAKTKEQHLYGIAFDSKYVYTTTEKSGRRALRAGGALETTSFTTDGGFTDITDSAHAYNDGEEHPYDKPRATADGFDYVYLGTTIGVISKIGASTDVAKSLDSSDRKVLVMGKKGGIVWLDPAMHAVLCANDYGVGLHYVLDAWTPVGADLVIVNDRVLFLDTSGRLVSAKIDGTDARYMGLVDVGPRVRRLWLVNDGTTIFANVEGEDGSTLLSFDVASTPGAPIAARNAGLVASRHVVLGEVSLGDAWLRARFVTLLALHDGLKDGLAPIVLSLDGAGTDATVDAALSKLAAFFTAELGSKAKITRAPAASGQPVATSIVAGIERASIAPLFHP